MKKLDLASTFVILDRTHAATAVDVTPTIWQELGERFEGFEGRVLVSCFDFDKDWEGWERHPAGDEIAEPGSYVVIPKNTWHTAKTSVPTRMIFVTPGKGTGHRPL